MKSSFVVALILIILVLVLGGGGFLILNGSTSPQANPASQDELIGTTPTIVPLPETTAGPTTTATLLPTAEPTPAWKTYDNATYRYRISYDPSWKVNDANPDSVSIQGDIKTKGWPNITISKTTLTAKTPAELKKEVEGLFKEPTMTATIGGTEIPAVLLQRGRSPQAYSSQAFYFINNKEVLSLVFTDVDPPEATALYQGVLENIEIY